MLGSNHLQINKGKMALQVTEKLKYISVYMNGPNHIQRLWSIGCSLHDSLSEPKVQFNRKILFKKFNINVTFYALMLTNHFHTKEDTSSAWTWKGTTEGSKKSWRPGVHGVCSSTIFWSENSCTPFPGRRLGYSSWVLPYDHDGDGDDNTFDQG
jgi:hypothetical protein